MNFWMKKIVAGLALAIVAFVLLANQEFIRTFFNTFNDDFPEKTEQVTTVEKNTIQVTQTAKTKPDRAIKETGEIVKSIKKTNSAADGLSRFYASISPNMDENQPRIRENIVYLPKPKHDLVKLLQARKKMTSPLPKNWQSPVDARPFRQGETLYQKLSEYANSQGLEVMWELNRDFLVKDAFRINKDILVTAYQVGKAIEGHFENGVNIYFCYQHRTIVLTDQQENYLNDECKKLSSNRQ